MSRDYVVVDNNGLPSFILHSISFSTLEACQPVSSIVRKECLFSYLTLDMSHAIDRLPGLRVRPNMNANVAASKSFLEARVEGDAGEACAAETAPLDVP